MNLKSLLNSAKFKLEKYSPELLLGAGIIGGVAAAVMACKATTKVEQILEKTNEKLEKVKELEGDIEKAREAGYTSEDAKKDTTIIYFQTGVEFIKLYGPSILLGTTSIACILASHGIMKKRNAALAAAYAAVDQSFKDYRQRVVEKFGKDVDHELKHGIKAETIEETVTDEKGKEKTVKKTINVADGVESGYVRYFTKTNPYWDNDPNRRELFFRSQQHYANDKLRAFGHVTLNQVYDMLGFNDSKAGMVVGWIFDRNDNPVGDNYVEFDIKEVYLPNELGQNELAYAIDFNVDGNIYDRL